MLTEVWAPLNEDSDPSPKSAGTSEVERCEVEVADSSLVLTTSGTSSGAASEAGFLWRGT